MLKALTFGLGLGAAVQAWRAWPPQAPVTGDSLALVFVVGLVAAYAAGRWRGRGGSTAVAVANAEATATAVNSVNVALVVPGHGAGSSTGGVTMPSASAPWFASPGSVPEITADQLEGFDLTEFTEQHEHDTSTG